MIIDGITGSTVKNEEYASAAVEVFEIASIDLEMTRLVAKDQFLRSVASSEHYTWIDVDASVEGIKDIWNKIKELWKKFVNWIKKLFGKEEDEKKNTKKRLDDLISKFEDLSEDDWKSYSTGKVKAYEFAVDNKVSDKYLDLLKNYVEYIAKGEVIKLGEDVIKTFTDGVNSGKSAKDIETEINNLLKDKGFSQVKDINKVIGNKAVAVISGGKVKYLAKSSGRLNSISLEKKELEVGFSKKEDLVKKLKELNVALDKIDTSKGKAGKKSKAVDDAMKAVEKAIEGKDDKELIALSNKVRGIVDLSMTADLHSILVIKGLTCSLKPRKKESKQS